MTVDLLNICIKCRKEILMCSLVIVIIALCAHIVILHVNIGNKQNDIDVLNSQIYSDAQAKDKMQNEITTLTQKNNELEKKITECEEKIQTYQKDIEKYKESQQSYQTIQTSVGEFKSYTDYKCLARNSAQWKLQERAYTDGNGLRKIGDAYLVALGSYYGTTLGTRYEVALSNGNTFNIILCDFKKNIHTDKNNKVTLSDGSILEFYVNGDKLPSHVKKLGTISAIPFFQGGVVSITKI